MPDIWFYHLQGQSAERVVPMLLERTLAKNWRCVLHCADPERVAMWDDLLWTYDDQSFLAHGSAQEGDPELQPIWLTHESDNPNGANVRLVLDGADPTSFAQDKAYERIIYLFNGADEEGLAQARLYWKQLKDTGAPLSYWQGDQDGRWQQKA